MSTPTESAPAESGVVQLDLFSEGEHRYCLAVSEWRARTPAKPELLTPAAYAGWIERMRDHASGRPRSPQEANWAPLGAGTA